MENKIRNIKALNYYITSISILIQTGLCIFILITPSYPYDMIIHLTGWNYLLCSFYLLLIIITDTPVYFFSYTKLEKINYFVRNSLSHIVFSLCFDVTISYWLGVLPFIYLLFNLPGIELFKQIYLHTGITCFMLIELFLNQREKIKINWKTIIILTAIFIVYSIVLLITKISFNISAYQFMDDINAGKFILIVIILYLFVIAGYFVNYGLVNRINKNNIVEIEKGEIDSLINNENEGLTNNDNE